MSGPAKTEQPAAGGAPGPSKLPLLIGIVNTVAVIAAVGFLYYTKLIFHRPPITEEAERARLEALHAKQKAPEIPGTIPFDPITVNIASSLAPTKPGQNNGQSMAGKLHYAQVGFVIEIRDSSRKDEIEAIRPIINDKLLSLLGRKEFQELTTVQGRYILRTQVLALINQLLAGKDKTAPHPNLVTQIFFTQFVVQ